MKTLTILALMTVALWLGGCAPSNFRPYVLDDSFGKSTQQTINASIANPQAAANPPADSPRKMDGYAGVNTMKSFRNSFNTIEQPANITINLGGGSGGSGGSGGQ